MKAFLTWLFLRKRFTYVVFIYPSGSKDSAGGTGCKVLIYKMSCACASLYILCRKRGARYDI